MYVPEGVEAVVFDLDGTLVEAMPYQELLVRVANAVSVPAEDLLARYYSVPFNLDEARDYHFSLCVNEIQKEAVYLVYKEFIDAKRNPKVLSGARKVLKYVQYNVKYLGWLSVCWTRGDAEAQKKTLTSAGFTEYFDIVVAVPKKTVETVKSELIPYLRGKKFILVGDSYEQDILPALGFAEKLFWISGSRVNKSGLAMLPDVLPQNVIEIKGVACLLPYLNVEQQRRD